MHVLDEAFAKSFIRMGNDGWNQGWHERNGGNLSYRLKPEDVNAIADVLAATAPGEWIPICTEEPMQLTNIAGEFFLITAAGRYFRNIADAPEDCMGIIEIDPSGSLYRIRWGFANGGKPTSELPTHMLNQSVKKDVTNGAYRVIYHCHPTNIIALTFVLPHDSETFTRELWAMISECAMVFPEGVAVIDWMVPGSLELARASAEAARNCDVIIWVHHGMFCAGEDFDSTFGLLHTVEKAAEIFVKVKSMLGASNGSVRASGAAVGVSGEPTSRITDENLRSLAASYDLNLKYLRIGFHNGT